MTAYDCFNVAFDLMTPGPSNNFFLTAEDPLTTGGGDLSAINSSLPDSNDPLTVRASDLFTVRAVDPFTAKFKNPSNRDEKELLCVEASDSLAEESDDSVTGDENDSLNK